MLCPENDATNGGRFSFLLYYATSECLGDVGIYLRGEIPSVSSTSGIAMSETHIIVITEAKPFRYTYFSFRGAYMYWYKSIKAQFLLPETGLNDFIQQRSRPTVSRRREDLHPPRASTRVVITTSTAHATVGAIRRRRGDASRVSGPAVTLVAVLNPGVRIPLCLAERRARVRGRAVEVGHDGVREDAAGVVDGAGHGDAPARGELIFGVYGVGKRRFFVAVDIQRAAFW
jgi:hypothetical protein